MFRTTDPVARSAFDLSADGLVLAYGTAGRTLRLVDLPSGKPRGEPVSLEGTPFGVRFDPAGGRVAVTTVREEGVLVLDAATGGTVHAARTPGGDEPGAVGWSADGSLLVVGLGFDIHLLAAAAGFRPVKVLSGHRSLVHGLGFHPHGHLLTSRSWSDGLTRVWDVPGGAELFRFDGHADRFAPDGRSAGFRGRQAALLCDTASPDAPRAVSRFYGLLHLAVSPDGGWAAGGQTDNGYAIWDAVAGGRRPPILARGSGPVAFGPGGATLATCRAEEVAVWEVSTGRKVWGAPRPQTVSPMAVAFAPAGDLLAYVHDRAEVRLLNARTGEPVCQLVPTPLPDTVNQLAFDPTGSRLMVVSRYYGIRVWDLRAVRTRLAEIGLDWPGDLPPALPGRPVARVEIDPGPLGLTK